MAQHSAHDTGTMPASTAERGRTVGLLLIAAAASWFAIFQTGQHAKSAVTPNAPFALEPWLDAVACRVPSDRANDSSELSRQALQLEQMAQARMQRAVFVPGEALRATMLLAEAALCAQQAHAPSDAARMNQQWLGWKSDVVGRFQGHRLRLDLALKNQRTGDALLEIKALQALLSGIAPDARADSALGQLRSSLEFEQRRIAARTKGKVRRP